MESTITTQIVAVAATLSGVVLTLFANALLERRRAREAHRLESLRLTAEHRKWLRDERTKAYASFSLAGEEVLQFLRADLPALLGEGGAHASAAAQARWGNLRTEFRKAYNQVQLLGAEQARTAALEFWRTGRDAGNDVLGDIVSAPDVAGNRTELTERLEGARNRLGAQGNRFLDACREDLQGQ
ncbi:MAG: hypothetical protein ACRDSK_10300 [Actinophytocola sp.]|uniref:hypothetical protein n=1 Tax=Actinophytocola sp. TaxID=1872138 RepID=UPI003D6C26DA